MVKGALQSLVGSIKVSGPSPSCGGTGVTVDVTPADGTLQSCGQAIDASHVLVKVASTLAFPTDANAASGSTITLIPPSDVYQEIDQALYNVTKGHWTGTVVPGGSEADVTLALTPESSTKMTTDLDDIAYLAGIIYSGVQMLNLIESKIGAATTKATISDIEEGTCAAQIAALPPTISLTAAELKTLATAGFTCARQVLKLGTTGVIAAVIGLVASLFENIVQTAFLAVETEVGWSTGGEHVLTITRAAVPSNSLPVPTTRALPTLDVPPVYDGIKPREVGFSADSTNDLTNITWSSWTTTSATGSGTWTYESCDPDCANGPTTPYPATIQLSQPVNGVFTAMTETTSGPYGGGTNYTYPNNWAMGASNTSY